MWIWNLWEFLNKPFPFFGQDMLFYLAIIHSWRKQHHTNKIARNTFSTSWTANLYEFSNYIFSTSWRWNSLYICTAWRWNLKFVSFPLKFLWIKNLWEFLNKLFPFLGHIMLFYSGIIHSTIKQNHTQKILESSK